MPAKVLTARAVEAIKPPPKGRTEVWDATLPGFGLRITSAGKRTWQIMYRFEGAKRRYTIGTHPALGLGAAREKARGVLQAVEEGHDPAAEKAASKRAGQTPQEPEPERDTVRAVAADYINRHAKRNTKCGDETERLLALHVIPALGKRDLSSVSRRNVRDLIDGVVDRGSPVQANRVLAAFRAMCNWAVEREVISQNPTAGVKKPTVERERQRALSDAELRAVWKASDEIGYPGGAVVKWLILTGCRRDEAREARWCEIDRRRKLWTLPPERSKNGRQHTVPISEAALALLDDLPTFEGGDFIFSAKDGSTPYKNVIKPKERISALSGVFEWTLHDLRRTAASGMGDLGIPGETIARVLNHSERAIAGVTSRYNRADQTEAKRTKERQSGARPP